MADKLLVLKRLLWSCFFSVSTVLAADEKRVIQLLDGGADVDARDNEGRTPLDVAVGRPNPAVEGVLVARNAKRGR